MILKSIFLRLLQFLSGTLGLYLLLMAGTFTLQTQFELLTWFVLASAGMWILWGIFTFLVKRYAGEMIREVALVVYPLSALVALGLGVFFGSWLEDLVDTQRNQGWTIILAAALLAVVMIVRCLDIRWLRNAEDLKSLKDTKNDF